MLAKVAVEDGVAIEPAEPVSVASPEPEPEPAVPLPAADDELPEVLLAGEQPKAVKAKAVAIILIPNLPLTRMRVSSGKVFAFSLRPFATRKGQSGRTANLLLGYFDDQEADLVHCEKNILSRFWAGFSLSGKPQENAASCRNEPQLPYRRQTV